MISVVNSIEVAAMLESYNIKFDDLDVTVDSDGMFLYCDVGITAGRSIHRLVDRIMGYKGWTEWTMWNMTRRSSESMNVFHRFIKIIE